MNLDITIGAQISQVSVKVIAKDGVVRRVCRLVLAREFDAMLATALRGDARAVLKSLETGGLTEAAMPIDSIVASAILRPLGGPQSAECTIPELRGVVAKCKKGKKDEPPAVKLTFAFEFEEKAWVFLGRWCLAQAEVTLRTLQTEMEFPLHDKGNGRKGRPRVQT